MSSLLPHISSWATNALLELADVLGPTLKTRAMISDEVRVRVSSPARGPPSSSPLLPSCAPPLLCVSSPSPPHVSSPPALSSSALAPVVSSSLALVFVAAVHKNYSAVKLTIIIDTCTCLELRDTIYTVLFFVKEVATLSFNIKTEGPKRVYVLHHTWGTATTTCFKPAMWHPNARFAWIHYGQKRVTAERVTVIVGFDQLKNKMSILLSQWQISPNYFAILWNVLVGLTGSYHWRLTVCHVVTCEFMIMWPMFCFLSLKGQTEIFNWPLLCY